MVIAIALGVLFTGKKEDVTSPAELRFYDDYLLLFIERKYYSERNIKQEYLKMKYSDITKVKYLPNTSNKRFQICGNGHSLQYAVKKDGSIAKQPSKDKIFEDGMIYFSTNLNQNIDFIEEIEKHSPLKVEIDNTNF